MLMNVYDSVLAVKGVGAKSLSLFEKLGIFTVKDLLYYFPYSYRDYSELSHVISISENEYGFFRIVSSEKLNQSDSNIANKLISDLKLALGGK